jgi:hypothetical protein
MHYVGEAPDKQEQVLHEGAPIQTSLLYEAISY